MDVTMLLMKLMAAAGMSREDTGRGRETGRTSGAVRRARRPGTRREETRYARGRRRGKLGVFIRPSSPIKRSRAVPIGGLSFGAVAPVRARDNALSHRGEWPRLDFTCFTCTFTSTCHATDAQLTRLLIHSLFAVVSFALTTNPAYRKQQFLTKHKINHSSPFRRSVHWRKKY